MNEVGLMLKTYLGDFSYCSRLIKSFHRYNAESLKLFLVVPNEDISDFSQFRTDDVHIIPDEEIPVSYIAAAELSPGLVGIANAGISKLGFWELGLLENYFAIDSDMVFIRPFGSEDFLSADGVPFLVVSQGLDQITDPFYFSRYWAGREASMALVSEQIGFDNFPGRAAFCSQILNSRILRSFKEDFLRPKGIDYAHLMKTANYEFFWYTIWALKQQKISLRVREELVKIVHHQGEHLRLADQGTRKHDLSRGYLGVIVNSNWSRQYGLVDFDQPPRDLYLTQGTWGQWYQAQNAG